MPHRYIVRHEPDRSCSVIQEETGRTLMLAGIPQTGLHPADAQDLVDKLSRMAARTEQARAILVAKH